MKRLLPLMILALAVPSFAALSVKRDIDRPRTLNVSIVGEPLSVAVRSLELYLPLGVQIFLSEDPSVTYRGRRVDPVAALRGIAAAAHVSVYEDSNHYWIRDDREPTVTLDVKDEDVRPILKSMQKQCELKNLIIDPDVQGKGTFLFRDVPCGTAFDIVFRTFRLKSVTYSNSLVTVSSRR